MWQDFRVPAVQLEYCTQYETIRIQTVLNDPGFRKRGNHRKSQDRTKKLIIPTQGNSQPEPHRRTEFQEKLTPLNRIREPEPPFESGAGWKQ
jgi:hypothetical protein